MKNYFNLIIAALLLFVMSCSSQNYLDEKTVSTLVDNNEFTFMAKRAHPTNYDVINVMNSLPGSTSSRMLELDYGYAVVVNKDKVEVTLPYFGRTFIPSYDNEKNSYRFTTKDFGVQKEAGKKNSIIYIIAPKDTQYVRRIIIEMFKNGSAYVSIDSSDRQPISYDGYIMKNEAKK